MSRSGYSEDCDSEWQMICWRGAVASAIKGKRGQSFLREMLEALDRIGGQRLIKNDLIKLGEVCAIGAVGVGRSLDMSEIDPEDREMIADKFGIAPALAAEIMYLNDEWVYQETPAERFTRMRAWVVEQIRSEDSAAK